MNISINAGEVNKEIKLSDGTSLILLDRLAKEGVYGQIECARNIFLVDANEKVIWQVRTDFDADSGSFTNILLETAGVKAYRWDGVMYEIDLRNGFGIPVSLFK